MPIIKELEGVKIQRGGVLVRESPTIMNISDYPMSLNASDKRQLDIGATDRQIIIFLPQDITFNSRYLPFASSGSAGHGSVLTNIRTYLNINATLSNMRISALCSITTGNAFIFTVMKNNVATDLQIALLQKDTVQTDVDVTHTVDITTDDYLAIWMQKTGGSFLSGSIAIDYELT